MIEKWIELAKNIGFDEAAVLNVATLTPMEMVREMCAADKCGAYHHNWTCPPECGTLEECEKKIRLYDHGILLQSVGQMCRNIDTRTMRATEERHMKQFYALSAEIRKVYPKALCLGAGGCRICKTCAYPEPCRFPEQATSSMEGYGLFVTQVCKDNNVAYYHGPKTITYTACILF